MTPLKREEERLPLARKKEDEQKKKITPSEKKRLGKRSE